MNRNTFRRAKKRGFDLAIAVPAFVACAPILVGVGIAVAMIHGRPVLFRQTRAGKGGAPFEMIKFRTMRNVRPGEDESATDAIRLTDFGRFLRSTSLDEFPSLVNVLRGEMSIVGPRPLLLRYNDRYSARQARRLDVKPGITGWLQVNGRNALTWDEKHELDVWYVDNQSLPLDLLIIGKTVGKVIFRDGIEAPGHVTMPEFMGPAAEDQ